MLTNLIFFNLISYGKKLRQGEHENESQKNIKKLTALTMSLLMMVSLSSAIGMRGFAQENNSETKYDDKFFEELKMATVEEELESAGITVKKGANFEDVMSVLESEATQSLQSS